MIKGEKISLRAVSEDDLPSLLSWRNNPDFRKYFREYRELTLQNQKQWFDRYVVNDNTTLMFSIVLNDDKQTLIGACGLCYINHVNRNADLSLYIGHEDAYIDDKGYAAESCDLLFRYGFGELNLHKIWTEIYEFDQPKFKLYSEIGLTQDGLLRDNYFHDGRWHNSRMMSILAKEYFASKEG